MLNTIRSVRYELRYYNALNKIDTSNLNDKEKAILYQLNDKGYCLLENFYNNETCEKLKSEIDRLIDENKDLLWRDEDNADIRAWGTEKKSEIIKEFYNNEMIKKIVKAHEAHSNKFRYTTMLGKIKSEKKNKGSGGGWHRDRGSFKQTKVILYLSDVDNSNGPFQYLEGSHKSIDIIKKQFKYDLDVNQYRFENDIITKMIKDNPKKLITIKGKAGTLLIANTRGIHRGKPFEKGERYALTNYYWFNEEVHEVIAKHTL